jgi:hypothetical protein
MIFSSNSSIPEENYSRAFYKNRLSELVVDISNKANEERIIRQGETAKKMLKFLDGNQFEEKDN